IVSAWWILWPKPTLLVHLLRLATRWPGRDLYRWKISISIPVHTQNIPLSRNSHDAVKVHAVNTDTRVVLDAQINMFADTEPKITALRKVPLLQFVFLDFQATF